MKILYLASDAVPAPKGAGVRIRRTVEALRALGHEVELFTPQGTADAEFPHATVRLDEPNFLRRMLGFREAARQWLATRSADLVQFRSIFEGVPAVEWAARSGARVAFEAHGFPSIELPYHHPQLRADAPVVEKLIAEEQHLLRRADAVFTPSATGRRFLWMRGVSPERIAVIQNAVDAQRFVPPPGPPPAGPPWRIVYVGTLAPWQGLATLLEAVGHLRGRVAIELHLVGPTRGVWHRSLRQQAHSLRVLRSVHFAGAMRHEDLLPVLHTAHLCVAPLPADSRNAIQGCCPLKLLEYMAAGCPIVATHIPPVLEVLTDGATARLVMPGSSLALAQGLLWMLEHPAERVAMADAARAAVMERFSPARFVAQLEQALALAQRFTETGCRR